MGDPPLPDHHHPEHSPPVIFEDDDDDLAMEEFSSKSRCCFSLPCFGSRGPRSYTSVSTASSPSVWERLQQTAKTEDTWWARPLMGLKRIREWSELRAGPKWKTFIRRFNRGGNQNGNIGGNKSGTSKFRYDPLSYSLNFDDGYGQNGNFGDEFGYFPDFSSRYASVPNYCKSSMDLGKAGIPISA